MTHWYREYLVLYITVHGGYFVRRLVSRQTMERDNGVSHSVKLLESVFRLQVRPVRLSGDMAFMQERNGDGKSTLI